MMGPEHRANDGTSILVGLVECHIPRRQEAIAESQSSRDDFPVRIANEERLAASGVDVGVTTEEGIKGAGLVPPRQKLLVGVTEKAANISTRERKAGNSLAKKHWHRTPR